LNIKFNKFFFIPFIVFCLIFIIELCSVLILSYIDFNDGQDIINIKNNRSFEFRNSFYGRLFNLNKDVEEIEYGFFDPITQSEHYVDQDLSYGHKQNKMLINHFGILPNNLDNKINSDLFLFGKFKYFLLGGSSALGYGADDPSQTISANLELLLNNTIKNKHYKENDLNKYSVINFAGVGAYSSNNLARFTQYLIHLKPNAIILINGLNDFRLINNTAVASLPINWSPLSAHNVRRYKQSENNMKSVSFLPFYSSLLFRKNIILDEKFMNDYLRKQPISKVVTDYVAKSNSPQSEAFTVNMEILINTSCFYKIPVYHFIQPINFDQFSSNEVFNYKNFVTKFEMKVKITEKCKDLYKYYNLIELFTNDEQLNYFVDQSHMNNDGQKALSMFIYDKLRNNH
jgi:hypothetical protein